MDLYTSSQAIATWLGGIAVIVSLVLWLARRFGGELERPTIVIIGKAQTAYTRSVVSALSSEIERRLPTGKTAIHFANRDEDDASFRAILEESVAVRPHVMILIPPRSATNAQEIVIRSLESGIPVLCIDEGFDQEVFHERGLIPPLLVTCDNSGGAKMAAEFVANLFKAGSVGIVAGPEDSVPSNVREGSFAQKALSKGLAVCWSVAALDWSFNTVIHQLESLLDESLPNAVFCCNDQLAIELRSYLDQAHPGHNVLIVGFDGIFEARAMVAAGLLLATVDQGIQQQAELTIAEVCKVVKSRKAYMKGHRARMVVDTKLISRASPAPPKPAEKLTR